MPLYDFDLLNGEHLQIDSDTGQIYDEAHLLQGSYNEDTNTFHDPNGKITGFFNEDTGQLFDQNHNLEATVNETTLGAQVINPQGSIEYTFSEQGSIVYDSTFQMAGTFKKIW